MNIADLLGISWRFLPLTCNGETKIRSKSVTPCCRVGAVDLSYILHIYAANFHAMDLHCGFPAENMLRSCNLWLYPQCNEMQILAHNLRQIPSCEPGLTSCQDRREISAPRCKQLFFCWLTATRDFTMVERGLSDFYIKSEIPFKCRQCSL